jgi:hypothetical protein
VRGLLFRSQNGVLRRLCDPGFHDRFGWNFDLRSSLRVDARFPLLLNELPKARQHEFAFLFDPLVSKAAEAIQEECRFVRLGRFGEGALQFGFGHGWRVLFQY